MKNNSVYISVAALLIFFVIVFSLTIGQGKGYYEAGFYNNLLVEAHGMLFDILVIGIFILALNRLADKQNQNKRYLDEIDDFRGWKSEEAACRIAGNIRRLNRNRYKGKLILVTCYLPSIDLYGAYLRGANLTRARLDGTDLVHANLKEAILTDADLSKTKLMAANLEGAKLDRAKLFAADLRGTDLSGVCLTGANLERVDLRRCSGLDIDQLSEAKSLYMAKLDPELMEQVKAKCPHLLEEPK